MSSKGDKLVGASTAFLYVWDEVYGWIHCSEKEKLEEAYERFVECHKDWFGNKTMWLRINLLTNYFNLCLATQKQRGCFLDEEKCKEEGCKIWWDIDGYKRSLELF